MLSGIEWRTNGDALPKRLRYLILAAYLAANNPKSSDNITFIGENTRKRKHSSLNNQSSAGGGTGKDLIGASATVTNQLFSVERLFSIYCQITRICEGQFYEDYGRPQLHSLVESLVVRKLLKKANNWRLQNPRYESNITRSLAEEIANSVQFPLRDFLYDQNRSHFIW